jgi:hypothetical protein
MEDRIQCWASAGTSCGGRGAMKQVFLFGHRLLPVAVTQPKLHIYLCTSIIRRTIDRKLGTFK